MYEKKIKELEDYIASKGKMAVAFSGGVDSSFLLYYAHKVLGDKCLAITVCGKTLSHREKAEGKGFCEKYNILQETVDIDELEVEEFKKNIPERCYYCKKNLFKKIIEKAEEKDMTVVADGSNADDLGDYRPGLKALKELGVISPLQELGLSKNVIRKIAKENNIPIWDKPSIACLATRIPYYEPITTEKLRRIESGEDYLYNAGYRDFRVRAHGDIARIELNPADFDKILSDRLKVVDALTKAGFKYISLDLVGFRSGSMNEVL